MQKRNENQLVSSRSVDMRDINALSAPISRIKTLRDDEGRSGFTLIELLVVVLIIGILAAVALPQYQKTVYRSRYATIKALVDSIAEAEEVYYLTNGEYTNEISDLDIDIGGEPNETSQTGLRKFDWGQCYVLTDHATCITQNNMAYQIYFRHTSNSLAGKRRCVAIGNTDTTSLQHQICQTETGKTSTDGRFIYP